MATKKKKIKGIAIIIGIGKVPKAKSKTKKVASGGAINRNYKSEYANYHARPEQKKNRASRNAARRTLAKAGLVSKGDGKDVIHKNGNPKSNRRSNLAVQKASSNRSFSRTRSAKKRNPYA